MKIEFPSPIKLVTQKGNDRITVETSETNITQIIDLFEQQMVIVQTDNLPNVIVVEPSEYDFKEYTRTEIVERFKKIVILLTDRAKELEDALTGKGKKTRSKRGTEASQTANA